MGSGEALDLSEEQSGLAGTDKRITGAPSGNKKSVWRVSSANRKMGSLGISILSFF